jgi:hypothetical protein
MFRLLLLLASATAHASVVSRALRAQHVGLTRSTLARAHVKASTQDDEAPPSTQDWRAVRARLVAQEAKGQVPSTDDLAPSGDAQPPAAEPSDGWMIELPIIEQGSVILASTQQRHGFGLHQQYFHKCAMLVLSHDSDFTRGIILNRPTPFKTDVGWPLWFSKISCRVQGFRTGTRPYILSWLPSDPYSII